MGVTSLWHWLILGLVITVLFGSKRIPGLMGDLAGGIRAFKRAMAAPDAMPDSVSATATPEPLEPGASKGNPSHG